MSCPLVFRSAAPTAGWPWEQAAEDLEHLDYLIPALAPVLVSADLEALRGFNADDFVCRKVIATFGYGMHHCSKSILVLRIRFG
jgi:hypothetical protein